MDRGCSSGYLIRPLRRTQGNEESDGMTGMIDRDRQIELMEAARGRKTTILSDWLKDEDVKAVFDRDLRLPPSAGGNCIRYEAPSQAA